jgi:hypothetical protein
MRKPPLTALIILVAASYIVAQSDISTADILIIQTATGPVTVKNFYKRAVNVVPSAVEIVNVYQSSKVDGYQIVYTPQNRTFIITLTVYTPNGFAAARVAAERALLSVLDIQRGDACRLKIEEVVRAATYEMQRVAHSWQPMV